MNRVSIDVRDIRKMAIVRRNLVFKNALMQYGFVAARYAFPLISLPFLARVLGPDAYGVRAYILSFMLFIQTFADFGFNMSGAKGIIGMKRDRRARNRLITAITISKLFFLAVLLIVSMAIAGSLDITHDYLFCVFAAYLGIFFNCLIPDFVFMGFEKMSVVTMRFVVSKGISLVLIILLVKDADGLMLSIVLDSMASLIAFLLAWRKVSISFEYVPSSVAFGDITSQIRNAVPFFLTTVSVSLFNSLATLLVGIVGTTYEVACWSLSITALNAVLSLYNPIQNAVYPHMVHSHDFALVRSTLIIGSMSSFAGAVAVSFLSPSLISILGGEEYVEGAYMISLLSPVIFASYPALMLGAPVLGALGYEKDLARTSIIAAVVYAALCIAAFALGFAASIVVLALCRIAAEFLLLAMRAVCAWLRFGNLWKSGR